MHRHQFALRASDTVRIQRFTYPLPDSIINLAQLGILDFHNNRLSGVLPKGIRSWKKLNDLNLANNQIGGTIPKEIVALSMLNFLDLSRNRFSGRVLTRFQNLKLNQLNLSYNRLPGELPHMLAKDMCRSSFIGNLACVMEGVRRRVYRNFQDANKAIDKSKWTLMSFHKLGFSEDEILNCLDEDNMIGRGSSGNVYKVVLSSAEVVGPFRVAR
ncbi:hypothetical protein Fmac_030091 [Flemingia macrophylla]|uniref:Uncharacterized protein n=1 Tax=Flemingia macrophylla TaxID=520843 RepID=A0ABD1LC75_9FABA